MSETLKIQLSRKKLLEIIFKNCKRFFWLRLFVNFINTITHVELDKQTKLNKGAKEESSKKNPGFKSLSILAFY